MKQNELEKYNSISIFLFTKFCCLILAVYCFCSVSENDYEGVCTKC